MTSSSLHSSLHEIFQADIDSLSVNDADYVDCSPRGKIDMIEDDAITSMVNGRQEADSILAQSTRSVDSTPAYYDVEVPLNASRLLSQLPVYPRVTLTEKDLCVFTSSTHQISSLPDGDQKPFIEAIIRSFPPSCLIPFTLFHQDFHSVFKLKAKNISVEDIYKSIGRNELVITAELIESHKNLVFDLEREDSDDKKIFFDLEAFQRGNLRSKNVNAVDIEIGKHKYKKVLRRSTLILSSCDLTVPLSELDLLSPSLIMVAALWSAFVNEGIFKRILERIFFTRLNSTAPGEGGGSSSTVVKLHNRTPSLVRCHVGRRRWGNDFYGLGVAFEAQASATLLHETSENHSSAIMNFTCSIVQGFPITLIETVANENGEAFTDHIDIEQGYIILHKSTELLRDSSLEMGDCQQLQENAEHGTDRIYENIESKNGARCTMLSSIIKNIEERDSVDDAGNQDMQTGSEINLFAWGDNTWGTLGFLKGSQRQPQSSQDSNSKPIRVDIQWLSPMEKIKAVACAPYHTLILTTFGSVFSCGDGSDGQLGHGSLEAHHNFRRIDSFTLNIKDSIHIEQISAGGDRFGCHSAAIDKNGALYTWGNAKLCGHHLETNSNKPSGPLTCPRHVSEFQGNRILKVSCGGSFTIALVSTSDTRGTLVYSWGLNADGRLGIGESKPLETSDAKNPRKSTRRTIKFQITPVCITSLRDIIGISAGASHAVAVSRKGEVYAWGRNNHGQCAVVPSPHPGGCNNDTMDKYSKSTGMWDDIWKPRGVPGFGKFPPLEFFTNSHCDVSKQIVVAEKVAAGEVSSAVIDSNGILWTWGGGNNAKGGIYSSRKFGQPKKMSALLGTKTRHVDLGLTVNAAVSDTGTLFLWGRGLDRTVDESKQMQEELMKHSAGANLEVPRQPVSSWLEEIHGREVISTACIGGTVMVLTGGMKLCRPLKQVLSYNAEKLDNVLSEENAIRSLGYDCKLIVAGGPILCHKVIICNRCPSMRKLILLEEYQNDKIGKLTEIFLPELRMDVATQLIHYLYTDEITAACAICLPELYLAATSLNLPRLMELCQKEMPEWNNMYKVTNQQLRKKDCSVAVESTTIIYDMILALGDRSWADVKFLTSSGREEVIFAHRCILSARSTYFCRLFKSMVVERGEKLKEEHEGEESNNSDDITTIILPDSSNALLKLLLYIYSGTVASVTTDELLEDIVIASRYELQSMVEECESEIVVVPKNAIKVLQIATSIHAPRLKEVALRVISENLGESWRSSWNDNNTTKTTGMDHHPLTSSLNNETINEIFDRIVNNNPQCILPRDRWESSLALQRAQERKDLREQQSAEALLDGSLMDSLKTFLGWIVLIISYTCCVQNTIVGSMIPIVNTAFLICVLLYFVKKM